MPDKQLNILNWNACGLCWHKHELTQNLREKDIDIACVTETHLRKHEKLYINGYKVHRKSCVIFVKNLLHARTVTQIISDHLNCGRASPMLLVDIKQAFDCVWQDGLLYKLNRCGLPPYLTKLTQ